MTTANKRSFLFLQGPCSPLFANIADLLKEQGHAVHKVNFNSGDVAYWGSRRSHWFRGRLESLPEFLAEIWQKYQITDQILFGDCRPVHKAAVAQAKHFGIRNHVFDGGYFRPLWVTLEREGVNGQSLLPKNPQWYETVGQQLQEPPEPQYFYPSFFTQATHDVMYHLVGFYNPVLFPHYRNHIPASSVVEYSSYIKRFLLIQANKHRENRLISDFIAKPELYFILPLQLDWDYQIINHSDFANMAEVIGFVLGSFANYAPANCRLLIKNHPLDPGLIDHNAIINKLCHELDIKGRVVYIETGNIAALIDKSAGMITVNSTSGVLAMARNCPTIALADPIYNMQGLTYQGHLNEFWEATPKPDQALFDCFRRAVIYATQINGSLYCQHGTHIAAKNAARIVVSEKSPLEELLWRIPVF